MSDARDDRPRVLVDLPAGQGTVTVRLMRWVQRPDGRWEAVVYWLRWAAMDSPGAPGAVSAQPVGDVMTVPAGAVHPLPGEDYGRVEHVRETRTSRRPGPRIDEGLGTLGERVERGRRRSGGMS